MFEYLDDSGSHAIPATLQNIAWAWSQGLAVTIGRGHGRITGIRLESGYGPGGKPRHFLVELDGAVEAYVKAAA